MTLVVFLRGVNVGGYRTFRPSLVAKELHDFDVINVGGAGTFIVGKPGPRPKFRAVLLRQLPFVSTIALCDSRDVLRLETKNPFFGKALPDDAVRFVSILSKASRRRLQFPATIPADGDWYVRLLGQENRLVFGVYRRHMKTIGCLGQIDKLFGVPVTTRNWNTILAVIKVLKSRERKAV